jgi:predicted ATPase
MDKIMTQFEINNFGPIKESTIDLGDLTVFVGPHATGKSLWLQFFKLLQDLPFIQRKLKKYGFDWSNSPNALLELYFG